MVGCCSEDGEAAMRICRGWRIFAGSIAAVIFGLLGTASAGASYSQSTGATGSWQVTAAVPGLVPSDLTCPTARTCFAVGKSAHADIAAASWTTDGGKVWQRRLFPRQLPLWGISCASSTVCVAVGGDFYASATGPLTGGSVVVRTANGGQSWEVDRHPPSGVDPRSVSCPTTLVCEAVGVGVGQNPGPTVWRSEDGGRLWKPQDYVNAQLYAVTCTSVSDCEVGGFESLAVTRHGGQRWTPQPEPSRGDIVSSISCSRSNACRASALDPGAVTGAVLTEHSNSWSVVRVPSGVGPLFAMACPTASTCEAVGGGTRSSPSTSAVALRLTSIGTWVEQSLPTGVTATCQAI